MEAKKKCVVCIGCGRCGENPRDLQIITDSFLKSELLSVDSADKGSFVIADIGTTTIAMAAILRFASAVCRCSRISSSVASSERSAWNVGNSMIPK